MIQFTMVKKMTVVSTRVSFSRRCGRMKIMEWRPVDLDQHRGEGGHGAQEHAHGGLRRSRVGRRTAQIRTQSRTEPPIEHERERDRADGQFDRRVGEITREQPTAGNAEDGTGQRHLQISGTPGPMIGPDRNGVLDNQDRQQDRGRFERRHDQAKSGVASMPRPATPPLLRSRNVTAGMASR